jgi:hypothetical protein
VAADGAWGSEPPDRLDPVASSKSKRKPKPKLKRGAVATLDPVATVLSYFAKFDGLEHLRARERAELVIIESGPADDPIPHARLRRLAAQFWALEMSTHGMKEGTRN